MATQEEVAEALFQKIKKIGVFLLFGFIAIIVVISIFRRIKNNKNYHKYGQIEGLVVGKRISKNKRNRYEISVEANGRSSIETAPKYLFECSNDSFFRMVEPRDLFIKRANENIFILIKVSDTIFFDTTANVIYSRKKLPVY